MRLQEKITRLPRNKNILLDTSVLLSDPNVLNYPNQKYTTDGVVTELFKLQMEEGAKGDAAKKTFDEVMKKIESGDVLKFSRKSPFQSEIEGLSNVDANLIHIAESILPNAVIMSCDRGLCSAARARGVDVMSIRTTGT